MSPLQEAGIMTIAAETPVYCGKDMAGNAYGIGGPGRLRRALRQCFAGAARDVRHARHASQ
ncbi:hypothetical protein CEK28_03375 [Xenophilus sp. AP218F]|nr:hypothetical protein CEK28_03375 [Xenophilus sp. AP218F]